ncbi:hypothetical protein C8Q79DRAFT_950269 [Trametes meyenii]|nr:hypothetical protein C8Q79DRAFT_950269 [Trametes meyenii]
MAPRGNYQGYVEDSEEEDILTFETSALAANANEVAGPSVPPKPPLQLEVEDTSRSSIQTPDFTGVPQARVSGLVRPPNNHNDTTVSSIQSSDFTVNRSIISDISSFSPAPRPAASSVQTAQSITKPADSSISTSAPTSDAPRPKPRPRPAYKKKDPAAGGIVSAQAGTSNASMSTHPPMSLIPVAPQHLPVGAMAPPSLALSTSSATSKSTSGKGRVSDSGVDMADIDLPYSQDIAERAKLRSRARTQTNGKGKEAAGSSTYADGVIELSSDDELSILPQAQPKTKPKPRPRKPLVRPSSEKDVESVGGMKEKGKKKDPAVPPSKRTKTTHIPDPGFESDVNTIPMPTSDFPIPAHARGPHSSQLPPSDPPPSSATSSSAHTHPPTSQASDAARGAGVQRDLSPLSSPPPPMPRKRKRPTIPTISGLESDDELSMDIDAVPIKVLENGKKMTQKELPAPPPPPVPSPSIVPETQPPVKTKPAPRKKRKDPDDDGDGEWDGDIPTKPSKSRKKARAADDDDFGGGGGEDDDDDWGASNAKGRAKAKKPARKSTAKEKKSRSKAKEKEKAPKSKEVIEDSDEERDKQAMPPPPIPASTSRHNDAPVVGNDPSSSKGIPPVPEVVIPQRDKRSASLKKGGARGKGASKPRTVLSDEEDIGAADVSTNSINADLNSPVPPVAKKGGRKSIGGDQTSDPETKENEAPAPPTPVPTTSRLSKPFTTPSTSTSTPSARGTFSTGNRAYTIGAKSTKHTPMSELIRRASAQSGSPFPTTSRPTYSPLTKASKSTLRRIAPLHPNRRTPPPAPPRPPPPKKSKKMLELEEKWEMELEDSVEGWYAMPEEERAALRRAKRDAEMGFFED